MARRRFSRWIAAAACFGGLGVAQDLPPASPAPSASTPQPFPAAQPAQEAPLLTPQQLDNLVAPIALYPDELLSQVLAASTYPLEIVDAEQWLQQNRSLPAEQLVNAAKQQNWDPSIQALAAFPDVLDILARDIRWTTDLGNAFLGQQVEVMAAVQRMRARAVQSGQLRSSQQQTVTTQYQDGQSAVQIAPANPQVIYVPEYQPAAVWGPPVYGAYPALWYPPAWGAYGGYGGYGYGIGFSPGIFLGNLFSGLLSFGPWGWGLNWFAHALFMVPSFFAHFFGGWWGAHGYYYGGGYHGAFVAGHPLWMHDPVHRWGVPYANRAVAARFGGSFGTRAGVRGQALAGSRSLAGGGRAGMGGETARAQAGGAWRGIGNGGRSYSSQSFGGREVGGRNFASRPQQPARAQTERPQASRLQASRQPQMTARNYAPQSAAPRQRFSTPSRGSGSAQRYSAPRSSTQHFSAPRASSSHSSAPRTSTSRASVARGGGSHGGGSHGGGHSGGGHSGGHRG
jgi:hypothetical protein